MKSRWITALLILLIAAAGVFQYRRYRVAPSLPLTEGNVLKTDGAAFSLQQLNGKTVIIQFFATWCIDCRKELPQLIELEELLNDADVDLLLVSDESPATLLSFKERFDVPFEMLVLTNSFRSNGIYTVPTSYIICPDGKVVFNHVGSVDWTAGFLRSQLEKCK